MPEKSTLAVAGMHCASCGLLIDETLEELPGVISSSTNLRKETTTVEYDPGQTSPAVIAEEISRLGYSARPA
jgi:copper chaperone